jgi:uncharacterized membrane protein YgcG
MEGSIGKTLPIFNGPNTERRVYYYAKFVFLTNQICLNTQNSTIMLLFQPVRSFSIKKILFIAAVLLIAGTTVGQIPKPMKNTYVNDFANVLTADQVKTLNQQIFDIEQQTSVQFAIVLVSNLPADFEIEDYSLLLARKWHVGKNKNGLVYVAAIQQHKQRLEPASGLQSTFTADACLGIMDSIKPSFKAGDYFAGLQTLVTQVQGALLPPAPAPAEPVQQPEQTDVSQPANNGPDGWKILIPSFFLAAVVLVVAGLLRSNSAGRNRMRYGNGGYPTQRPVYNSSGPYQTGVGDFVAGAAAGYVARTIEDDMSDARNSYSQDNNYTTPSNSSSDNIPSNWGNWGSDSSNIDSSSGSSSFDTGGFSGGDSSGGDSGATSGW